MITRRDPSREGLSLRRMMDQLLEQSFVYPNLMLGSPSMMVPMDVCETPNGYEVDVALPGVRPEDIELTVDQYSLTIRGRDSLQNDHQNQPQGQMQGQQQMQSGQMQGQQQKQPGQMQGQQQQARYRRSSMTEDNRRSSNGAGRIAIGRGTNGSRGKLAPSPSSA